MATTPGAAAPATATPQAAVFDEQAARVREDGWTILRGAVDPDTVAAVAEALSALEAELGTVPSDNLFEGRNTWRVYNLLVHGPVFEAIPLHPAVLPVVERVLDPGLLISSLSSIAIGPGEQAQPLHADDQLIPLPRPHVPLVCNTMWAITEFTAANGATRLVPGSHRADTAPDPFEPHDTVAAEMAPGDVLVWVGSLWHGGGANTTDARRVGIAMNYCAGWVRQQENQQLGVPVSLARRFPRRLQELMGYSVYHGLIGHIDKRHPGAVVLKEDRDLDMVWDAGSARP